MKMFRYLLPLLLTTLLAACGSGNHTTGLNARLTLPPALSAVPNYQVKLSLLDSTGNKTVFGPTAMTLSDDGSLWQATNLGIADDDYKALIEIFATSPVNIVVAQGTKSLHISSSAASTTITFDPADFSTVIDTDGDTLSNLDEINASLDPLLSDTDQDGIADNLDQFPLNISEAIDEDGDGIGNNEDNCISVFNKDQKDTDGDGIGDACDTDDDNDGVLDTVEIQQGSNPLVADTDGDGISDGIDNCVLIANADQVDTDSDGIGNACDTDNDNDGVLNTVDNCPFTANADQLDTNGDGVGDACTNDADGDGISDANDNCPLVANADQKDTDGDLIGDACDTDDDNDGLLDAEETGLGSDHLITNPLSIDTDGDGVPDAIDNCPLVANAPQNGVQLDTDQDGEGDACDCDPNNPLIKIQKGVFVATNGDDSHSGSQNDPVKTITKALKIAQTSGSDVYVTVGTYNESLIIPSGVSVYGRFGAGTNCLRNLSQNAVVINSSGVTTATITDVSNPFTLDGLILKNSNTSLKATTLSISSSAHSSANFLTLAHNQIYGANNTGQSSQAVLVQGASPIFVNNIIDGGDSRDSLGLELQDSPKTEIINNTIHGGRSTQSSEALEIERSSPLVVNNIFFTENTGTSGILDSQILIGVDTNGLPAGMVLNHNLIYGLMNNNTPKLFSDIFGNYSTDILGVNSLLDVNNVAASQSNITDSQLSLDGIITSDAGDNYHLISESKAIDAGTNPASLGGISVTDDLEGNPRPKNSSTYDLGAYEDF